MIIGSINSGSILARHLANFTTLRADERAAIDAVAAVATRSTNARRDLIREGDPPHGVLLILSGWACRYKMLEDGRRQIVSFLIPGDMCDLHNAVLAKMDHSIGALTAVRYAALPNDLLHRLSIEHPRVGQALWWQMLVNIATQREWTMNIGQRNSLERIGSLFCELLLRLRAVGLSDKNSIELPLTQIHIAEATGMTPVHVNRSVQQLRSAGLISWTDRRLTIPDLAQLQRVSLFAADYLHLDEQRARDENADRTGAGK